MKLPQEVREMRWDDYYSQAIEAGEDPLALSKAISACLEDSICGKADDQVSQVKSAMQPASKKQTRTSTDIGSCEEVSARKRLPPRSKMTLCTPANSRGPPNMGKTPLITPKFDTSKLSRTVSRVARADEVLVSLSGSPVVASIAKKISKAQENNALIPLGDGETLNIPLGVELEQSMEHLDEKQVKRLEELQESLANMLKMKNQVSEL